jgi:UDP-N-acetylglucosamine 1-carboxyvinyltransferase
MEQFIIKGPVHLKGEVDVSGSKNAALPIIAASLLINEQVILKNIPRIKDILTLLEIIKELGVETKWDQNDLYIDASRLKQLSPAASKVRNLRASVLLVAPLLVRNGKISLPHPGGCLIGSRPIDVHIAALKKMGAEVIESQQDYLIQAGEIHPADISTDFSVTGTENIIIAACLAKGVTNISLAAAEPHVEDLCRFLNSAGAKIEGLGTHNLRISGVTALHSTEHEVIPDQIEAGTFAIAAAATKGEVRINGFVKKHQESLLSKFDNAGVEYQFTGDDQITIGHTYSLRPFKIRTEIYPGFPTDLQAPIAVLATQATGTSEIYETIFEGRLSYINELSKMGASCVVRDAHQASITGPTPLFGTRITSFDLRAGATLIIAALIAQGESRLDQIEVIDRGYENIEEKFRKLGADIKRVKLKEIE